MSGNFYKIEKSFLDRLPSGFNYQYPNQIIEEKPDLWINVNNLFGTIEALSIGPNGVNVSNNLLQIDVYYLKNRGMARHLETINLFSKVYEIGEHIGDSIITGQEIGGNRVEGRHRVLTLTVYYETQFNRGN